MCLVSSNCHLMAFLRANCICQFTDHSEGLLKGTLWCAYISHNIMRSSVFNSTAEPTTYRACDRRCSGSWLVLCSTPEMTFDDPECMPFTATEGLLRRKADIHVVLVYVLVNACVAWYRMPY